MRLPGLSISVVCVCVLSGCSSGEPEDIKQWMAESSRGLRGRVQPLPELKPFPIVSYDASKELDPFSPARVEPEKKEGGGKQPDFDRPREQLESFPLESLQFTGVVSKSKGQSRHALIQVDGVIYQVRIGNYMGQNFGRVVQITDTEVVLMETVQDPTGQTTDWVERQTALQLQEGTKGKETAK